jgi:acyl-CoA synthetase (AMP-forming)/AMP-acid ligase II
LRIDKLAELARDAGTRTAVATGTSVCTYRELLDGIDHWGDTLQAHGLRAGDALGLTGESCPALIMLLIAAIRADLVVVPFLSSSTNETATAMATADVDAVARFGADGVATWTRHTPGARHPLVEQLRAAGRPGLILFTSGSSGVAKAALHDVSRIWRRCAQSERPPATALVFLNVDHIGGVNTLFHILLTGGTAVFPADRSVDTVCTAIERHRAELLPGTPTFLNMLLLSSQREAHDLSSLKLVTYGTEPMPPSTLAGLRVAMPWVRCKQTYGMTEIGILPTRSEDDDSVWVRIGGPGYETRIVDGILWVRAETSMLGYLNAPSPFDADGWLDTGDLVEERDGALRILGRRSELINVAGEKVHPGEIEDVILQADNIADVVVKQKASAITGQLVVATVRTLEPEDPKAVSARVREHCRAHLSAYKVPAVVLVTDADLFGGRFKKSRRPDAPPATAGGSTHVA